MKLRYLFSAVLSSALLFAGCEKDTHESFDNLKVSQSYLSIPEDGGSVDIVVTSTEDWQFVISDKWPEVVSFNKDANDKTIKAKFDSFGNLINDEADIKGRTPSWLGVSVLKGKAGETKVTFTAEKSAGGREIEIALYAGNNKQFLRVRQGNMEAASATCKEVIDGPDGKTYRVKGVCTSIVNTTYGNWYLNDGTGEVYIYGTLDSKGAEKNFSSWKLEVGDVVECEGPKTTYGSTIELVNVSVISITKSLAKIVTPEQTVPKEGGEFDVKVAYKGESVLPSIPQEYRSWISIVDMQTKKGEVTKIEPNPADTAIVTVSVIPNVAGDRSGVVDFTSKSGKASSSVSYNFTQEGSILDATIPEFLAAAEGATQYRVSGTVKSISVNTQYQNANVTITDVLGNELYVYRMTPPEGTKIEDLGVEAGDDLTVVGQRGSYNGNPQMVSPYYESHVHYVNVTIPEFLAASVSTEVTYRVTGKIINIKEISAQYKNATLTIADEAGSQLYVFRMKAAEGGKPIEEIGLKVGDELTVIGQRGEYSGSPQMVNCYYQSHVSGGDTPDPGNTEYETTVTYNGVSSFYDDGVATVNGVENVKVLKFGTSKLAGECTVNIPAGAKKLVFYGVAWKGKDDVLSASFASFGQGEVTLKANDGATGNSPYTITASESDYYTIEFSVPVTQEMPLTLKSTARCIIWGVQTK